MINNCKHLYNYYLLRIFKKDNEYDNERIYDDAAITNISIGIMNEKKQIDIIVKDLFNK